MILQNKISMKHTEKLGVLIIISSLIYFDDTMLTLNSIEPRIISNIGVALVLLSNQNSYITKLLSTKAFSLIGLSSYSIYLFHQPLFAFWRISKNRYELQDNIYNVLLIFVILLFFSYLNWKFVERVFQQKSFKSVLKFIGISLLIISIFIFFSNKSNGFANKYSYVPEEVLFYSTNPNIYPNNYDHSEYKFLNSKCNKKLSPTRYCTWFNTDSDQKYIFDRRLSC